MHSSSTTFNRPPSLYRFSFATATLCYTLFSSTITTAAAVTSTTSANAHFSSFAFTPTSSTPSLRSLYRTRNQQHRFNHHHKFSKSTHTMKSSLNSNASSNINDNCPLSSLDLPSPLILGSGSFTRKLILEEMNIPFLLKVKPIDEYEIGIRENESYAKELVLTLAKAKADALINGLLECNNGESSENDDNSGDANDDKFNLHLRDYSQSTEYIVLTADQVVTCNNQILEKPKSVQEAHSFIEKYSKHPPQTVGSVVLTHLPSMKQVYDVDISTIYFKPKIGEDCQMLVQKLLDDDAPILSCAGGLMVEHRFVQEYIDSIDGSVDGVMGLSKDLVFRLLRKMKEEIS